MSSFNRSSSLIYRLVSAGGKHLPVLVVLILTLCVFQSWSRTTAKVCGTEFSDPISSAYQADIVIEVKVRKRRPSRNNNLGERYNITTAKIKSKKKHVFKGSTILGSERRLILGEFGPVNNDSCVTEVSLGSTYVFFLNVTVERKYYRINAFPISANSKTKKLLRNCKSKDCGVRPCTVKQLKKSPKNGRVRLGGKLYLRCRGRGNPLPLVTWMKDGQPVVEDKRIRVKEQRKRKEVHNTLEVHKFTPDDAGTFTCLVRNVVSTDVRAVNITVKTKKKTTPVVPRWQYHSCPDEDETRPYCLNNGSCLYTDQGIRFCLCLREFLGHRCEIKDFIHILENLESKQQLARDRTLIIIGILISVLVFIAICIASYLLAKNNRTQFSKRRQLRVQLDEAENTYRKLADKVEAGDKPPLTNNMNKTSSGNRDVVITRRMAENEHRLHCQSPNYSSASPQIVDSAPRNLGPLSRPRFLGTSSNDTGKVPNVNKALSSSNEQLLTHSPSNSGHDSYNITDIIDAVDGLPNNDSPPLSGDAIPMHDMPPRAGSSHDNKTDEQLHNNNNNIQNYNSNNNNNNSNDSESSSTATPPPVQSPDHQPPLLPPHHILDDDDIGPSDTYSGDDDDSDNTLNDDRIPNPAIGKFDKVLPLHISDDDLVPPKSLPNNSDYHPSKFPLILSPLDSPDKDLISSIGSESRSSIPFSESAPELYDNVHVPKNIPEEMMSSTSSSDSSDFDDSALMNSFMQNPLTSNFDSSLRGGGLKSDGPDLCWDENGRPVQEKYACNPYAIGSDDDFFSSVPHQNESTKLVSKPSVNGPLQKEPLTEDRQSLLKNNKMKTREKDDIIL